MAHTFRWCTMLGVVTVLAAGCSSRDEPGTPTVQLTARDSAAAAVLGIDAKAALDSGNVLFRAAKYPAALARYRAAAELAPRHPAPYFGIYMVARATGNAKLVDSALAGMRARSMTPPDSPHGMLGPQMPPGHPATAPGVAPGLRQ